MKIYTKQGDHGETGLYRGGRVPKDDLRIHACGNVDELNSIIGWVRSVGVEKELDDLLLHIQGDLFTIGADLAAPAEVVKTGDTVERLSENSPAHLEAAIDRMVADLPPLRDFILPGGSQAAAGLHLARSVCRRAERHCVSLSRTAHINHVILIYLNRLSDFFFTAARWENFKAGIGDTKWRE